MLRFRSLNPSANPAALLVVTVALYLLTARIGLTLALPPERKASPVWPPSGIALAVMLLAGRRAWPGIWLGAFLANVWDFFNPANTISLFTHVVTSSGIAVGSTLQAVLGSSLLRRWHGEDTLLSSVRSTLQFAGLAPLMCLVAATFGATVMVLAGFTQWAYFRFNWWTWWLGDTVGVLVVTPLLLSWCSPSHEPWNARRVGDTFILAAVLIGVGVGIIGNWSPSSLVTNSLSYLAVPILVWAAFRLGPRGATTGLLAVSAISIWGTIRGNGPFVQKTPNESLLLLQSFMGVMAMMTLTLVGVLAERRRVEDSKKILIGRLRQAIAEIRTLRGLIPICAWCKKIRTDEGSWQDLECYLHNHTEAQFDHGICPGCYEERMAEISGLDIEEKPT